MPRGKEVRYGCTPSMAVYLYMKKKKIFIEVTESYYGVECEEKYLKARSDNTISIR